MEPILYFCYRNVTKIISNFFQMKSKIRSTKLQPEYRESDSGRKIIPRLSISGVWLERCGFKAGDTVRIIVREELLIIQPVNVF